MKRIKGAGSDVYYPLFTVKVRIDEPLAITVLYVQEVVTHFI